MKYIFLILTLFLTACGELEFSISDISKKVVGSVPTSAPIAEDKNLDTLINTDIDSVLQTNSKYTILIVENPSNGVVTIHNGEFKYIPNSGFVGVDHFSYKILDTETLKESQVAVVTINVKSVNQSPQIVDQNFSTNEDVPLVDQVVHTDPENDTVSYLVVTSPLHGSFNFVNSNTGSFIYLPNQDYNGTDEVVVSVSDGEFTVTAKLTITVNPVDDPVVAKDLTFNMNEAGTLIGQVQIDNPDSKIVSYELSGPIAPSKAYFEMYSYNSSSHYFSQSGEFTLRGKNNDYGTVSFKYKVFDGSVYSNEATITVNIANLPSVPYASNCGITVAKGAIFRFGGTAAPSDFDCGDDTDPTGKSTLSYVITTAPLHGTVTLENSGRTFKYQSDGVFVGSDSFEYSVYDGALTSPNTATAYITIYDPNSAPVASDQSFSVQNNASHSGQLVATDVNNDILTYQLVSGVSHGSLSLNADGTFTYTPQSSYSGSDSFVFKANDGQANSANATVSITVTSSIPAGNTIPSLSDLTLYLVNRECSSGCWSSNKFAKTDSDNDNLTYSIVTPSSYLNSVDFEDNGSAFRLSLTYNYISSWPLPSSDFMSVKANDGFQDSNTSKINLKFIPHIANMKLGDKTSCILAKNDQGRENLYCWGSNSHGQLGIGNKVDQYKAVKVLENVFDFGIGSNHMCAVADPNNDGGGVYCWGSNSQGQLGDGTTNESLTPKKIFTAGQLQSGSYFNPGYKTIGVGYNHACVILQGGTHSGQLWCWGSNQEKQFTTSFDYNRLTPEMVVQSGVKKVQAGKDHSCIILSSNDLECWGNNAKGQLGNSSTVAKSYNSRAFGVMSDSVQDITLGNESTCATTLGNDLYCAGWNAGEEYAYVYFDNVGTVSATDSLQMFGSSYCVPSYSNSATCWGSNSHGQLGSPLSVSKVDTFSSAVNPWTKFFPSDWNSPRIATGATHTCAYKDLGASYALWSPSAGTGAAGVLYCWGDNSNGQLGSGDTTSAVETYVEVQFN